jgi:hypothetical protein
MKGPRIKLTKVDSAMADKAGYHPKKQVLRVQFPSGAVYDYAGVDAEKHAGLMSAESFGRHFNTEIKPHHEATRVK